MKNLNSVVSYSIIAVAFFASVYLFYSLQANSWQYPRDFDKMQTVRPARIITVSKTAKGKEYLVDATGRTLYTFDADKKGASTCAGECKVAWPALVTDKARVFPMVSVSGTLDIIKTTGQVTYDGKPLYYYMNDTKPGDMMGDGMKKSWHVVKP